MYASQMMNGEHQSRRFRLNREIIRASARDSPGAIAPRETFTHETRFERQTNPLICRVSRRDGERLDENKGGN